MCLSYLYVHTVWGLRPLIITNRDGGYRTRFGGADWNRGGHKRPQMRGAGELPSRFLSTCRGGRKPETKVFGLEGCPLQVAMSSSLARVFQLGWSDLTDEGEFALQVQFGLGENGAEPSSPTSSSSPPPPSSCRQLGGWEIIIRTTTIRITIIVLLI